MDFFKALDAGVQKILYYLVILLFIALICILSANVGLRLANDLSIFLTAHGMKGAADAIPSILPASLHWFDEIVELCFAALVFYGAAALWARGGHFSVGDWLSKRLPSHFARVFYRLLVSIFSLIFIAVFFWFSVRLCMRATELSTVFQIPKSVMYSCMPVASFIMGMYAIAAVLRNLGRFSKDEV